MKIKNFKNAMAFKLFATLFELIMLKMTKAVNSNYWTAKGKIQADRTVNLPQMLQGHICGYQISGCDRIETFAFES